MTDQGEIHFILGMSIKRNRTARTLSISQEKYLESLLNRFGMEGCKPMSTPLDPRKKFHKRSDKEEQYDQSIYQQAIGYGRPNVSIFAKFHSLSLKLIRCR